MIETADARLAAHDIYQAHQWKPSAQGVLTLNGVQRGAMTLFSQYQLEWVLANMSSLEQGGLLGIIGKHRRFDASNLKSWVSNTTMTLLDQVPEMLVLETEEGPMITLIVQARKDIVPPSCSDYELLTAVPETALRQKFLNSATVKKMLQHTGIQTAAMEDMVGLGLVRYHEAHRRYYPTVAGWISVAATADYLPGLSILRNGELCKPAGDLELWIRETAEDCCLPIPTSFIIELLTNAVLHRSWEEAPYSAPIRLEFSAGMKVESQQHAAGRFCSG
jgi:hypothetical protein